MKRIVTFVVLLALIYSQCAPRQYTGYRRIGEPIIISARIGEIIDLEECNNYDLFQGIDDFQSATFYSIQGGGLVAEIQTSSNKLVAVNHDSHMHMILKEYVENHEWVQNNRDLFERKWKIEDYDVIGFPITKHEVAAISNPSASLGCALGSAAVIFGVFSIVSLFTLIGSTAYWWIDPAREQQLVKEARTVFIVGAVAAVGTGGLVGAITSAQNRRRAVEIIKESRVPRIVE